jgi:hypothetical protein
MLNFFEEKEISILQPKKNHKKRITPLLSSTTLSQYNIASTELKLSILILGSLLLRIGI